MLKQAINIEKGFDSAKTPKQLIHHSSSSTSKPKGPNPVPAANVGNTSSGNKPRHSDRRNDSNNRQPDAPRPDNRPSNPQNRNQSHCPCPTGNNRPNNSQNRPPNNYVPNKLSPLRNDTTRDKSKDQCHDCHQYGHWAGNRECKGKIRAHRVKINPTSPPDDARSRHSDHSVVSDIAETAIAAPPDDNYDADMENMDYGDDYYSQSHRSIASSHSNYYRSAGASYFELDDESI
jgi:hypothetical protein